MAEKKDRPFFNPGNRENVSHDAVCGRRITPSSATRRTRRFSGLQEIKYKDLKEVVSINIDYRPLPFQVRQDYIRLNEQQVIVPISLEVQNKDLTFKEENGVQNAKIAVYGIITSITNRIIMEFDDDMLASYQPENLPTGPVGQVDLPEGGDPRQEDALQARPGGEGHQQRAHRRAANRDRPADVRREEAVGQLADPVRLHSSAARRCRKTTRCSSSAT